MMTSEDITQHRSFNQVVLDVDRCAGRFEGEVYYHRDGKSSSHNHDSTCPSETKSFDDKDQDELKKKLTELIVRLLIKKPDLHYYQGFHDVCLTYMILLGDEKKAEDKLDKMIDSHFKIYMQPTMLETQEHLAQIPIIIGLEQPEIQVFLEKSEVGTIFALSWVITWFSHVINDQADIERIFKFLEKHDTVMVLYLCSVIVLQKKEEIVKLEAEMSTVHHYLTQLPRKEKFDFRKLFKEAEATYDKWPPNVVKKKLDDDRRVKMYQLHNFNLIRSLAHRLFEPYLSRFINHHPRTSQLLRTVSSPFGPFMNTFSASNPRTAIIVMVLASALLFQYDRWTR